MKTVIAYILVVVLSQFCLTLGVAIFNLPIALLLNLLPHKVLERYESSIIPSILSFVGGFIGSFVSVLFAYWVFRFLVGPSSFHILPFLACVIGLIIPISNDYKTYRAMKKVGHNLLSVNTIKSMITDRGEAVTGEIIGLIVGGCLFLFRAQ